jgi:hypothetical protein
MVTGFKHAEGISCSPKKRQNIENKLVQICYNFFPEIRQTLQRPGKIALQLVSDSWRLSHWRKTDASQI